MYRSNSYLDHFIKGAASLAAFWGVLEAAESHHPFFAVTLLVLGLAVVRGCPTCWFAGLMDMMMDPPFESDCVDGQCIIRIKRPEPVETGDAVTTPPGTQP